MEQKLLVPRDAVKDPPGGPSPLTEFIIARDGDQSVLHIETEDGQHLTALIPPEGASRLYNEVRENVTSSQSGDIARMMRRGERPDFEHSPVRYNPIQEEFSTVLRFQRRWLPPVPLIFKMDELDSFRAKAWAERNEANRRR